MKAEIESMVNLRSFGHFARDIKLSHSIFALPFAFAEFFLLKIPVSEVLPNIILITICMVSARSFAMGSNRLLDAEIDAKNLRTSNRMIPSGKLSASQASFWIAVFAVIFIAASFGLNRLAGFCSFGVLFVLGMYPFWKRISWLTHWYLGLCLALVPIAVDIALDQGVTLPALCLSGGILFWTGGFDVIYALMDFEHDQKFNIQSVPSFWGITRALNISRASYVMSIVFFIFFGVFAHFSFFYWIGLSLVVALMIWQHYLIRNLAVDEGKQFLDAAFFNLNAMVSVVIFLGVICEIMSV